MFDLARRALRATAACTLAVALAAGGAAPALAAQGSSTLALPVEFNDFNADNVFFEYKLESGLDALGTGQATGLVESTLGANGKPVYTQAAVEGAARAMMAQLGTDWEATAPEGGSADLYAALKAKLKGPDVADVQLMDASGLAVSFADGAWEAVGEGSYVAGGETLYKGAAPAWKQDGDAAKGADPSVPLTRTYEASELLGAGAQTFAGTYVGFNMWNSADNAAGVRVTLTCGSATASKEIGPEDAPTFELEVPADAEDAGELTVSVAPLAGASLAKQTRVAAVKLAASADPVIDANGNPIWGDAWTAEGQMGTEAEGNRFYDNGWRAFKGQEELSYEGLYATSGTVAWTRSGDGVIGHEAGSTIARGFDVSGDAVYRPRLWNAVPGMKVSFYAGDSVDPAALLGTLDASGQATGFIDGDALAVPEGVTRVTAALTAQAPGAQVAALSLTALGSASKLGDFAATQAKYADGSKGLEDAATCMDYAYCVLNHLYDSDALSYGGMTLKSPVSGLYKSITLNKNADAADGSDTGYSFVADGLHSKDKSPTLEPGAGVPEDGYKNLVYDLAAGTISNVEPGTAGSDDRAGFFPLDDLAGGQRFSAQFEYETDPVAKADKRNAMGIHNYHYSMVSHSSFTYDSAKKQFFTFEGDDDTYLYINNRLVIDLGGAHLAQRATVALEDECPQAPGQTWAARTSPSARPSPSRTSARRRRGRPGPSTWGSLTATPTTSTSSTWSATPTTATSP